MEYKILTQLLDNETQTHCSEVSAISMFLAEKMGLSDDEIFTLSQFAPIHDIGKIKIPQDILFKAGKLTDDEYELVKKHSELGVDILVETFGINSKECQGIIRNHHENWDGSGYPDGLKGNNIPLLARILSVADVYEALTTDRVYKEAWEHLEAVNYIIMESGTKFDPDIVKLVLEFEEDIRELVQK